MAEGALEIRADRQLPLWRHGPASRQRPLLELPAARHDCADDVVIIVDDLGVDGDVSLTVNT